MSISKKPASSGDECGEIVDDASDDHGDAAAADGGDVGIADLAADRRQQLRAHHHGGGGAPGRAPVDSPVALIGLAAENECAGPVPLEHVVVDDGKQVRRELLGDNRRPVRVALEVLQDDGLVGRGARPDMDVIDEEGARGLEAIEERRLCDLNGDQINRTFNVSRKSRPA